MHWAASICILLWVCDLSSQRILLMTIVTLLPHHFVFWLSLSICFPTGGILLDHLCSGSWHFRENLLSYGKDRLRSQNLEKCLMWSYYFLMSAEQSKHKVVMSVTVWWGAENPRNVFKAGFLEPEISCISLLVVARSTEQAQTWNQEVRVLI